MALNRTQRETLKSCLSGWYTAPTNTIYRRCMRLMNQGYLTRKDGPNAKSFTITEKGVGEFYRP